jgi:hypothetical protein
MIAPTYPAQAVGQSKLRCCIVVEEERVRATPLPEKEAWKIKKNAICNVAGICVHVIHDKPHLVKCAPPSASPAGQFPENTTR